MKLLFLFTSLILIPSMLNCQTKGDPIYLNYSFYPTSEWENAKGKASYQNLEAIVVLPSFKLSKSTEVFTNLSYKQNQYDYKDAFVEMLPENLNDFRLGFILRQSVSNHWEIGVTPQLNLRTDFSNNAGMHGLFPSLGVLVLKTSAKNKDLIYGVGISYNNDLNKDAIFPVGYLKYSQSNFRIYTILPSFFHFVMTPSPRFEYGLSYRLESAIFKISEIPENTSKNYLKASTITIAPTLAYNLHSKLWLNYRAGYAGYRGFQILNENFNETELTLNNKFKSSFFATLGLSLRME
ncbi:MAG: DUF6268 family outer membrane beta-barrel protein [Weeksellaceae bacterium]